MVNLNQIKECCITNRQDAQNSQPIAVGAKPFRVDLFVDQELVSTLQLNLTIYSLQDRIKRSLITFFAFLGAALASLFIPILHFVLVPGFFIGAVVMSIVRLKEYGRIDFSILECPLCHAQFVEKSMSFKKNEDSIRFYCLSCKKNITATVPDLYHKKI
jgi:hypothetical protein